MRNWTLAKMSDLSTRCLLSELAEGQAINSNKRSSHAHPYSLDNSEQQGMPGSNRANPSSLLNLALLPDVAAYSLPHSQRRSFFGVRRLLHQRQAVQVQGLEQAKGQEEEHKRR